MALTIVCNQAELDVVSWLLYTYICFHAGAEEESLDKRNQQRAYNLSNKFAQLRSVSGNCFTVIFIIYACLSRHNIAKF